jgi:phage baseplate assembly protein W
MKASEFKKLIKEAVKEVIQEELRDILLEAVKSPKQIVRESYTPSPTHIPTPSPSYIEPTMSAREKYMGILGETAMSFNTNDLEDSVAIGVNIPFSAPSVFTSNYQTKDAIKNNLLNFFLTNQGERPLNPSFGGGLRAFIFEQITSNNLDFLKEDVEQKLTNYFPNVKIEDLTVTGVGEHSVKIMLKYSIINTNITDGLEITFTPSQS